MTTERRAVLLIGAELGMLRGLQLALQARGFEVVKLSEVTSTTSLACTRRTSCLAVAACAK